MKRQSGSGIASPQLMSDCGNASSHAAIASRNRPSVVSPSRLTVPKGSQAAPGRARSDRIEAA
jgi:hypothetical protein